MPALVVCQMEKWNSNNVSLEREKDRSVCPQYLVIYALRKLPTVCPPAHPVDLLSASQAQQKDAVNWLFLCTSSASRTEEGRLFALDHRELLRLALTGFPVTVKE